MRIVCRWYSKYNIAKSRVLEGSLCQQVDVSKAEDERG